MWPGINMGGQQGEPEGGTQDMNGSSRISFPKIFCVEEIQTVIVVGTTTKGSSYYDQEGGKRSKRFCEV